MKDTYIFEDLINNRFKYMQSILNIGTDFDQTELFIYLSDKTGRHRVKTSRPRRFCGTESLIRKDYSKFIRDSFAEFNELVNGVEMTTNETIKPESINIKLGKYSGVVEVEATFYVGMLMSKEEFEARESWYDCARTNVQSTSINVPSMNVVEFNFSSGILEVKYAFPYGQVPMWVFNALGGKQDE